MKRIICIILLATIGAANAAEPGKEELLQRVYEIRTKFEQDQHRANQEGLAQVPLAGAAIDSPTVTDMRREMESSLTQFQQSFRCLDIDVNSQGGNTTIICGANSGAVSSEHTTAERDVITIGAAP